MLESAIEQKFGREIKRRHPECLYLKFESPGYAGVPDRILVLSGKIIFIEWKQRGKKPTKLQSYIHHRLRELGCTVYVFDNLEEALEKICGN